MHSTKFLASAVRLALAGLVGTVALAPWPSAHGSERDAQAANGTMARLPVADSRYGPTLLGNGPTENARYVRRLAARGVEAASVSIAYPILSGLEPRHETYRRFYTYVFERMADAGIAPIVVLTPQHRDREYLRGQPAPEQCEGPTAERLVAHATAVAGVLPAGTQVVLDYRPSVLARAEGCAAFATPEAAASLVSRIIAALASEDHIGPISASADIDQLDEVDALASVPGLKMISANTLNSAAETVEALEAKWSTFRSRVSGTGRSAGVDSLWIPKPAQATNCEAGSLADALATSQSIDEKISNPLPGAIFTIIHETDLWMGNYLDADEFNCAPGFGLKNRRLVQLKSRQQRRQPL